MDESVLRMAGIDYEAALARFVGKRDIYEKYLKKFLEDTHAADAMQEYEQQNYTELLEQVHALKGIAGTLGLVELYETTAEIVRDLRDGAVHGLGEQMQRMEAVHERICQAIRTA